MLSDSVDCVLIVESLSGTPMHTSCTTADCPAARAFISRPTESQLGEGTYVVLSDVTLFFTRGFRTSVGAGRTSHARSAKPISDIVMSRATCHGIVSHSIIPIGNIRDPKLGVFPNSSLRDDKRINHHRLILAIRCSITRKKNY